MIEEPDPLCILDASVVIDLLKGGILIEIQSLPIRIGIPDVVLVEIDDGNDSIPPGFEFDLIEFSGDQVLEAADLISQNPSTSMPDLFAYLAAREQSAILLTGDSRLREFAEANGINVHGVLWILDLIVQYEILLPLRAAQVLKQILDCGSFLPADACAQRLKDWEAPGAF